MRSGISSPRSVCVCVFVCLCERERECECECESVSVCECVCMYVYARACVRFARGWVVPMLEDGAHMVVAVSVRSVEL